MDDGDKICIINKQGLEKDERGIYAIKKNQQIFDK